MSPILSLGPFSVSIPPLLALLAGWFGLGVLAKVGGRLGLPEERAWNLGVVALAAALIVARFAHVVQFWPLYRADPWLLVSIRSGGLLLGPGLVAAGVAGYGYMLLRRMDPLPVLAALACALLVAGAFLEVSAFLTGRVLGTPTSLPWGVASFEAIRHPVGLYRAGGMGLLAGLLWWRGDVARPGRFLCQAVLGYGVLRLVADGFVANADTVAGIRVSQLLGFLGALVAALLLARWSRAPRPASDMVHVKT